MEYCRMGVAETPRALGVSWRFHIPHSHTGSISPSYRAAHPVQHISPPGAQPCLPMRMIHGLPMTYLTYLQIRPKLRPSEHEQDRITVWSSFTLGLLCLLGQLNASNCSFHTEGSCVAIPDFLLENQGMPNMDMT